MTVCQPPRQKIFMGKFTQLCVLFTRLRRVTLICNVIFLIFMEFFMMKKTAIALGIAAMAFGAQAAEVFKNADTAIEVNLDLQFSNLNIVDTAGAQARNYINGYGTQVQFKAKKIINEDLTVFGQIEFDPDPVTDNATVLTDDMKFGVTSKTWGTIQLGQFDSYMEDELMEIANYFQLGGGVIQNIITEPTAGNDGRHLLWKHQIGGFGIGIDVTSSANNLGTSSSTASTDGSNGFATTVSYTLGDLKLVYGSSTIARYKTDSTSTNAFKSAQGIGASYSLTTDAGVTKVAVLSATNTSYNTNATYDGLDTKYNMISIVHDYGPWRFGVINSVRDAAMTSSVAATTYNEVGTMVSYDIGKGAKLYVQNSNYGYTTGLYNQTEVGFVMSF